MKTRKIVSVMLVIILVLSTCIISSAAESKEVTTGTITNATQTTLYAHGVSSHSEETEAWQIMQWNSTKNCNYFYLPSGVDEKTVEIYNNYTTDVTIDSTTIPTKKAILFNYDTSKSYQVNLGGKTSTLKFMKSTAEAAVFLNNSNADGNGTGLWEFLSRDKSNSAAATGAIVNKDGTIVENASVKKIKGRGNTTWYSSKKPFNVTFNDRVSIDGMEEGKKYSFLANFQDASLSRNRFLYDLSDEVGMPYASDSRYIDFYVDGVYKGSYQAAQKVDTGKGNLLSDIDETGYLNVDTGAMNDNFAFVCEIDASASDEDYYFYSNSGNKVTLKVPELSVGDKYYNDVLRYAQKKFDEMFNAVVNDSSNLNQLIDIDSYLKLYFINELGKNWDSGVSSTFFAYKQDENGNWKFYASPVWDYDNSLGNATGVDGDLRRMGVTDYTQPTGWWCKYKGGESGSNSSNNLMFNIARNKTIQAKAPKIWCEEFVPAIKKFASTGISEGELYSKDVYYNYISGSADMNYTSGWKLNTGSWICDHSSLRVCTYDYDTKTFKQATSATRYDTNTFKGEYDYTIDWMTSRAAWLSSQLYDKYTPPETEPTTAPKTEPTTAPKTEPTTAPKTEPTTAPKTEPTTAPKTEPTTAPKTEPTTAPKTEPTTAPDTEPTTAPKTEPTTASDTEPTSSSPISDKILIGDTDLDGNINVKDATLIQLYSANLDTLTGKELIAADVDKNNDVNVKDATYIQMYCAQLKSECENVGTYKDISNSYNKLQDLLTAYCSEFDFNYPTSYYYYIYTKESFDAFLAAKQNAEKLLADGNATDEQLENMISELKTARNNLVTITRSDSYKKLADLLAENSWDFDYTPEYWYDIYTKESYDAYLAAKQKADKLLADENPTDEDLENMIKEFNTAKENLVKV